MLVVRNIWGLACLLLVARAADRNEKPNVVIMLMDDVSCGKFYPGNFQKMLELMVAYHLVLSALISFYFSQFKSFRRCYESCVFKVVLVCWLCFMSINIYLQFDRCKGGGRGGREGGVRWCC